MISLRWCAGFLDFSNTVCNKGLEGTTVISHPEKHFHTSYSYYPSRKNNNVARLNTDNISSQSPNWHPSAAPTSSCEEYSLLVVGPLSCWLQQISWTLYQRCTHDKDMHIPHRHSQTHAHPWRNVLLWMSWTRCFLFLQTSRHLHIR